MAGTPAIHSPYEVYLDDETFITETWDRIQTLGYDARFKRMWDFYLTSCAGAFHTGICDVTQITLRRPA